MKKRAYSQTEETYFMPFFKYEIIHNWEFFNANIQDKKKFKIFFFKVKILNMCFKISLFFKIEENF